jgi:hypothetical protein
LENTNIRQSAQSLASKQSKQVETTGKNKREEKQKRKKDETKGPTSVKMCWTIFVERKPTKSTPLKPFQKHPTHLYISPPSSRPE